MTPSSIARNAERIALTETADSDPYPFYEALRRSGEVAWDQSMQGWLVLSYEACRLVETREDLFPHVYADADATMVEIKGGARNVTLLTGDEHKAMHRLMVKLFRPVDLDRNVEAHIRPVAQFLIDRFAAGGRAELARDFADQLPARTMSSLFGMQWRDDELFERQHEFNNIIFNWIGAVDRGESARGRALAASHAWREFLLPYVSTRRKHRGEDLISQIWEIGPSEVDGLDDDTVATICQELYLDGSDTTAHALANAIYLLLTNDVARTAMEHEPDRFFRSFVEEVLRLYGPVHYRFRRARQDIEVAGVRISSGDLVLPVNSAASRDPDRYPHPAEMDLSRRTPTDHLAFNRGPRTCVGAGLARAELRVAIHELTDKLLALRLATDRVQPSFRFLYMRSFRPLHVRFDTPSAL
jgi:cytochrome P450